MELQMYPTINHKTWAIQPTRRVWTHRKTTLPVLGEDCRSQGFDETKNPSVSATRRICNKWFGEDTLGCIVSICGLPCFWG